MGFSGGEDDEIVAVDHLVVDPGGQVARTQAHHPTRSGGIDGRQPPRERPTVRADDVHGVALDERPTHRHDPSGEQAVWAFRQRSLGTEVDLDRTQHL